MGVLSLPYGFSEVLKKFEIYGTGLACLSFEIVAKSGVWCGKEDSKFNVGKKFQVKET